MTYQEAFDVWEQEIKPLVVERWGEGDYIAMAESWNDYTDDLFSGLKYHYCPAWDDEMPDCDYSYIADQMGLKLTDSELEELYNLMMEA